MSDLEQVRDLARVALTSLERSRKRIDDLNVYPVPDGDTGTNLVLTVRAIVEALDGSRAEDRAALVREVSRAALMGARGNSGVILSQIVRGAAEALGEVDDVDAGTIARALRAASDAAYRAVRRPVEGTMLTVVRALAEEGEVRAAARPPVLDLLVDLVRRGDEAVAATQEQLDVLREAGVVDAGGAGLAEIVRGIAAAVTGEELPEAPPTEELAVEAIHQELSRYRYCTVFVLEGDGLDADRLECELEPLGDSLLVVGDASALKVHVHTDDPGAALSLGAARGVIEGVEIANMHRQTERREERLLEAVENASDVVAVVAGEGNRAIFESLGAARVVEGGQSMNPSTADLVAAVESVAAPAAILLPNNSNVILAAEQAARAVEKPVEVVPTDSIPAGLAAMVVFDGALPAAENAAAMQEALEAVATGEVTIASRDAVLNGLAVRKGNYFGLAGDDPVAEGESFDEVARAVVERLLAEPREVLTLLRGADAPELGALVADLADRHPELEIDVQEGGQPHYALLLSAE
ncbi:MAG TPA: DAK2 domain-containing protein [Gaiellaceae bacterium]|jgi:DAK2 domain fusion protein YloV|nr:DAK2 domain-containing protein [Gaiellaceae bacterium]